MIATLAAVLSIALVPQGGQGGGGFGGFGGGAGGVQGGQGARGGGGNQGNLGREGLGQEQTFSHILTQGDKTDWPMKCKAGEVLILSATSDTFDPGIEFCDKDDKKIAENDDEEEGVQSALLLVYIEKDGEYRAHVKNYRNAGGGKYEFKVRRFMTQTVTTDGDTLVEPRENGEYYFRVLTPKDKLISLHSDQGSTFTKPIGPDGKPVPWRGIYSTELMNVFESKQKTEFYVKCYLNSTKERKAKVSAVVATEHAAEVGKPVTTAPADKGLHIWKFKVKDGDFLKVQAKGARGGLFTYFPSAIGNEAEGGRGFDIIQDTKKWADTVSAMFMKNGEVEILVPPNDAKAGYTFSVVNAWKPWDGVSPIDSELAIGEKVYYGFDAKPGHMVRIGASAKTFDLVYQLFHRHLGQIQAIDDDGTGNMNATTTIALPQGGRHYLAISCFGGGGGGTYRLDATPIKPATLTLGQTTESTLSGPLDGLWTVKLGQGQTLGLRVKSKGAAPTMLTDPSGLTVPVRWVMIHTGDYLGVFDTEKAGEYRIWRQFQGDKHTYSMKLGPITD